MALSMILAAVAQNSVTRTLELAQRSIGGFERLAEYLGATHGELKDWLGGERKPPTRIYMRALDLVARGPFAK